MIKRMQKLISDMIISKYLRIFRLISVFPLICITLLSAANQPDTISVTNFGAVPGSRTNATPYIIKALEACRGKQNAVLWFPAGRYDFWPQHCIEKEYFESNTTDNNPKRLAIFIKGQKDLTIDCNGSEFVFHDRMQPFTVDHSTNIAIKNTSIDWDIPLTAQCQVVAVTDEYIDIEIDRLESPFIIENSKLVFIGEGWKSQWNGVMEFDKDTRLIPPMTGDVSCLGGNWRGYKAKDMGDGLVRLEFQFKRKPEIGNYLVLRHSARDHAGIFISNSKNVTLENINIYHTAGLGVLAQYSEDLTYQSVNVVPNPKKNRYLSGHDDGFHYSNCKGSIIVGNCEFAGLMDDPINVHGTSVRIMEKISPFKLRCKFMHEQSVGMEWGFNGDKVGFIENEAMATVGNGTIISFVKIDNEVFDLVFSQQVPVSMKPGDALENLTWTPSVSITGSRFKSCRARGILISTPGKVVIENNIFESSGAAILIAGDANYWYESGAVTDVLIRNNKFMDPCMSSMYQFCEGIISIYPEIPKPIPGKQFHRNIRIENNEFHPFDYPVLYARSVNGLSFTGNTLIRSTMFQPFHERKSGLTFDACKSVTVSGNKLVGDVLGRTIALENMTNSGISVSKGEPFSVNKQNASSSKQ
jgi:hypothetical protein